MILCQINLSISNCFEAISPFSPASRVLKHHHKYQGNFEHPAGQFFFQWVPWYDMVLSQVIMVSLYVLSSHTMAYYYNIPWYIYPNSTSLPWWYYNKTTWVNVLCGNIIEFGWLRITYRPRWSATTPNKVILPHEGCFVFISYILVGLFHLTCFELKHMRENSYFGVYFYL